MPRPKGMISLSSMKKKTHRSRVTFKEESSTKKRRTTRSSATVMKKKKREVSSTKKSIKSFGLGGLGRAKRVIHQTSSEEDTPIKVSEKQKRVKTCSKQKVFASAKKTKLPEETKKRAEPKPKPKKNLPDISYIVNWKPSKYRKTEEKKEMTNQYSASTETLEMCNVSVSSDVEMDLSSENEGHSVDVDMDIEVEEEEEEEEEEEDVEQHTVVVRDETSRKSRQQQRDTTIVFHESAKKTKSSSVFQPSPQQCVPFSHAESSSTVPSTTTTMMQKISTEQSKVPEEYRKLLSRDNILNVNGTPYLGVSLVGRGGSSKVYKVFGPGWKTYALKYVQLKRVDRKTTEAYRNEIKLLQKLRGKPGIIQMKSAEICIEKRLVLVVMEYGQLDLNQWHKERQLRRKSRITPHDVNELRLIWQQMLTAVNVIHEARIVHGDLKPANFVFVCGSLKLIDFGIAKQIESNDTTNIVRDTQVGTLNFMAPEALGKLSGVDSPARNGSKPILKLSRSSDIWSLGCILYQLVYGRPPFASLPLLQKMRAILDPKHKIKYPKLEGSENVAFHHIRAVIDKCLEREARKRPQITGSKGLLRDPFLFSTPSSSTSSSSSSSKMNEKNVSNWIESLVNSVSELSSSHIEHLSQNKSEIVKLLSQSFLNHSKDIDLKGKLSKSCAEESKKPPRGQVLASALCQGKENLRRRSRRTASANQKKKRKNTDKGQGFALRGSALKRKKRALQPIESTKRKRKTSKVVEKEDPEKARLSNLLRNGLSHIRKYSCKDEDETDGTTWTFTNA